MSVSYGYKRSRISWRAISTPDSNEYERLVDFVCARDGAAIGIKKAHEYLKIKCKPITIEEMTYEFVKDKLEEGHPIDVSLWHNSFGRHSALIVGCGRVSTVRNKQIHRLNYVKLLNAKSVTHELEISWNNLSKILVPHKNINSGIFGFYFYKDEYKGIKIWGQKEESFEGSGDEKAYNILSKHIKGYGKKVKPK